MSHEVIASKAGLDFVASSPTALGISWFNNQFKAVAVQRGAVTGAWARVAESTSVGEFEALLSEAIQKTGFRGSSVALVLAQSWSAQQMVELPPVKGAALKKLLDRQAQQQKFFAGEAAWSYEESAMAGDSRRVILHLVPQPALDQLAAACHRHGLHLVLVVPPSTVFQQQLRKLPLEKSDVALLASETGGATTVVIGREDGRLLLVRTLHGTWKEGGERLALDLNRTIQFANQKYGISLTKALWLYGPGADEQVQSVQSHLPVSVAASPEVYDPFYAATRVLALRSQITSNFISPLMQRAQQRGVFAKAVLALTVFTVIVSLAATAFALLQTRQQKISLRQMSDQYLRLEAQQVGLQETQRQLAHDQNFDQTVQQDRPPAVPLWLFAGLSEMLPTGLTVTNFHIQKVEDSWKVELAGLCPPLTPTDKKGIATSLPALLAARLTDGPFHLKLMGADAATKAAARSEGGISTWLANLSSASTARTAEEPTGNFAIEGVLR